DVSTGVVLAAGIIGLMFLGAGMASQIRESLARVLLEIPVVDINSDNLPALFARWSIFFIKLISPFLILVMAAGLLAGFAQTGFLFTVKPLVPKLSRLSPLSNLKNKFSSRALVELAKGILKVGIVGLVGYLTVRAEMLGLVQLMDQETPLLVAAIAALTLKLAFRLMIAFVVIAVLDLLYQNWKQKRDLRMSKQEVKDEHRQSEGDPHIKGRIRQLQLKASLNRMIRNIPKADVVVTNPVHVAVALKYDPLTMHAPQVVAKGKRKMALRIKEIAREHGVPIIEEPELARALYRTTEIGMEIPYDLYQAVAEIIALVYKLKAV
ncbi:MAG: flagellar biosynthesis protein FlhB, partial [Calditrichaeota bacterium]|nr:flagellar biosynthesis protein FlhB [Calditrichota bacterium]